MDQKDLKDKVELHYIGTCPICGKGQMLQGSAGWTCNHFKNWDDLCSFTIFGSYCGYVLTEEDAVSLITQGTTERRSFVNRQGKPYTGVMQLTADGKIKVIPCSETLSVTCPFCGGKVRETASGWMCDNFTKEGDGHCLTFIPKTMFGRAVTRQEAETVLDKGRTGVLDGFMYEGKTFSSCLLIDREKGCHLDGRICRCPKCGGTVYAGVKAYNCSNFRNKDVNCDFVIWRSIYGHDVTPEEVKTLCSDGATGLIDFMTRNGSMMTRSMRLENWKVVLH